jgi:hypothetical protein
MEEEKWSVGRTIWVRLFMVGGIAMGVYAQLEFQLGWWGWPLCILVGGFLGMSLGVNSSDKKQPSGRQRRQAQAIAEELDKRDREN